MGGTIFKSLELFYGTNSFTAADAAHGNDAVPVDRNTRWCANEFQRRIKGLTRQFRRFTQDGTIDENIDGKLDVLNIGEEIRRRLKTPLAAFTWAYTGCSTRWMALHWAMQLPNTQRARYFQACPTEARCCW